MPARCFGAVDIGASGGRVVLGEFRGDRVDQTVVHRFDNGVVESDGHLRWPFDRILGEIRTGLAKLPPVESIGIDTWGVDYGLLDEAGTIVDAPIAYRDDRTADVIDDVHALVSPGRLFEHNGLQHLPFNTIYQLAAERGTPSWQRAAQVALIPDLIAQQLTGALATEVTNASTTGLLDARTRTWSNELLAALDLDPGLLPPLDHPGDVRGVAPDGTRVVSVGSHDTASAVVGVPATSEWFAYVACGTWSLVGLELRAPVLTDAARLANFTNEAGVDGRTRFLRNVGGLWLLQECLRTWGRHDVERLVAEAATLPTGPLIDVDDPGFIAPGDMPARIATAAGARHLDPGQTVRCIVDSLAVGFARTIEQASALAGQPVTVVHVVGGGSQNRLLCQLLADATGRPVVTGPVEATALGNLAVQARAAGALPHSLDEMRAVLAPSLDLVRIEPR